MENVIHFVKELLHVIIHVIDGKCVCYNDPEDLTNGNFTGETCNVCIDTYFGFDCKTYYNHDTTKGLSISCTNGECNDGECIVKIVIVMDIL